MRRKIIVIVLLMLLSCSLIGCNDKEIRQNNSDNIYYTGTINNNEIVEENCYDNNYIKNISVKNTDKYYVEFEIINMQQDVEIFSMKIKYSGNLKKEEAENAFSIILSREYDMNSDKVNSVFLDMDQEYITLSRPVISDTDNKSCVELVVDGKCLKNDLDIEIEYSEVVCNTENENYNIIRQGNVVSLFSVNQINEIGNNDLYKLVDEISKLEEKYKELFSDIRYEKNIIIDFTENIPSTALAGNIVYVDRESFIQLYKKSNFELIDKNNILAVISHEIGHLYDFTNNSIEAGYTFDREMLATIKSYIVLFNMNYNLSDNFFVNMVNNDNIYSYEKFTSIILQEYDLTDKENAVKFSYVLSSLKEENIENTKIEKYYLFENKMEEIFGIKIQDIVSEKMYSLIINTYKLK